MTKLNWRDAGKELPALKDNNNLIISKTCAVVVVRETGQGHKKFVDADFYRFLNVNEGYWQGQKEGETITHWTYLDELPIPEE